MAQLAGVDSRCDGICSHPSHSSPIEIGGTVIEGFPTATADGIAISRIGDQVETDCGHFDVIATGSPDVTIAGVGAARVGDTTGTLGIYVATIITGIPGTTAP